MSEKRSCCCGALPAVWWWLLTVLGLALLFWLMVSSRQNSVETDLTARATDGLKAASLEAVQVNLEQRGRDAQLIGQVASDAEREQAVKLVESTYGVRVVENAIEVLAPVAAATTVTTAIPTAESTVTAPTAAATAEPTATAATAEPTATAPTATAATAEPTATAATAEPTATAATAEPTATAPTAAPRFALIPQAGQWVLQGALSSQAEVNQAVASAEQIYGAGNVINQLSVESVAPAAWLAALSGLKDSLMGIEQAGLKFADNTFTLMGSVGSEQAKADVLAKVQQVLGVNQLDNQLTVKLATLTVTTTPTAEPAAPVAASTVTTAEASVNPADPASPTAPAPVVLTTEQQSCQDQINTVMTGKEILFETNQARIKQTSLNLLSDIAKIVNQCKAVLADKLIRVGGHTDNIGEDAYNQNLSQERADAVKVYLNQQGLDLGLLQGIGYGETQPLASNDTEQGRAQNRRISFDIIQK